MAEGHFHSPLSYEHVPQRTDSHVASALPEPSFLDFFKQSLLYTSSYCTDSDCCTFFNHRSGWNPTVGDTITDHGGAEITYPLVLFEDLRGLPPQEELHDLVQKFQTKVLPGIPFLSAISSLAQAPNDLPLYVRLPEALFGTVVTDDTQPQRSLKLWQACHSLVTGTVEVDNSLGRTIAWHNACILLISFGCMQGNEYCWRQAEMINGYLQPTIYRLDCLTNLNGTTTSNSHRQHQPSNDSTAFRKLYFLVDTIRSTHLHTPSTADAAWTTPLGPGGEHDFRSVCDSLIFDGQPLPSTLTPDEHLLILTSLLADINNLFFAVGPLTTLRASIYQHALEICRKDETVWPNPLDNPTLRPASSSEKSLYADYNPHVPQTADHEFGQMRDLLGRALAVWEASCKSHATGKSPRQASLVPMLGLCKLLLEAGPAMYLVPVLVGYCPGFEQLPHGLPRPCDPHLLGIHLSNSVVDIAMEIFESVEVFGNPTDGITPEECVRPPWYPLALFYGALAIWARMREDEAKDGGVPRTSHFLLAPRRLLRMFQTELEKMKQTWDCARRMTEILESLI